MKRLVILLILFIYSCAVKTWNVEGPSELSNGLVVKIDTKAWRFSPSDLDRYVLPIFISLENKGKEPISIRREDIFLVDDKGRQYNPIPPGDVANALRRGYGVGFSFSVGYWSYPFGLWWSPYYAYPPSRDVYPDLVNKALVFGELQPGATLSGFVYFQKIPEDAKELTLNIKGYKFRLKASRE